MSFQFEFHSMMADANLIGRTTGGSNWNPQTQTPQAVGRDTQRESAKMQI